jgi:hypothetical protein
MTTDELVVCRMCVVLLTLTSRKPQTCTNDVKCPVDKGQTCFRIFHAVYVLQIHEETCCAEEKNTKDDTTVRKKHPGNFDMPLTGSKEFICVILKMEMNLKSELKIYFFSTLVACTLSFRCS